MAMDPEDLKSESCAVTKGHVIVRGWHSSKRGRSAAKRAARLLSFDGGKRQLHHIPHLSWLFLKAESHQQGFVAANAFAICTTVTTSCRLYPLVFHGVSVVKCKLRLETLVLELLVSYSGALQQNQGCGTQI